MKTTIQTAVTLGLCSFLLGGCIKYVSGYKKAGGGGGASADTGAASSDGSTAASDGGDTSSTDGASGDGSSTDSTASTEGSTSTASTEGSTSSTSSEGSTAASTSSSSGGGVTGAASSAAGKVGGAIKSIPVASPGLTYNICSACHSKGGEAEKVVLNAKSIPLLDEAYKGSKKANHTGLQSFFEGDGRKALENWLKAQN